MTLAKHMPKKKKQLSYQWCPEACRARIQKFLNWDDVSFGIINYSSQVALCLFAGRSGLSSVLFAVPVSGRNSMLTGKKV